jgi:serine/threonine-protein kinase
MSDRSQNDDTRWDEVEALFDEALELPPEKRAEWLDAAAADPELRRRVDDMLDAHARAESEGFLEASAIASSEVGLAGETVGPYRVVEELGRGGMGVVYLAERADGQFEHAVALKVVKRGLDTDQISQRFLQERQILARLRHPHIGRLLDGGVTSAGQPYFVMEYINGVPLTDYCDEHQLPVDSRLQLFQQVAEAVQYAHRNLVIHRDLKPSNILVTENGTVKLLDFGIAKLVDDDNSVITRTGMRVLTPAYASPEHEAGDLVTTAADVYSLGVVLYELLAGQLPRPKGDSKSSFVPRPSTVVTSGTTLTDSEGVTKTFTPERISSDRGTRPEQLRRRLSGDLDAICLKALRPEPDERYDSAAAFLDDVKRHLAGLPVAARAGATGYRFRKFVQRNRVLVLATVFVILSLAGGLAAALWQAQRAQEAAVRAETEAATAEQVKDYLVTVFSTSNPWEQPGGAELTARELLERGVAQIDTLGDKPVVQAELLDVLGNAYGGLGHFEEARSLLERALEKRRESRGLEHEEVAESLMSLAGLLMDMGLYDEAEPLFRDALDMRRRLLEPDDDRIAAALNDLAALLNTSDRYEEAEPLLRESLAIQRRIHPESHPSVAVTMANLAGVLRDKGAYDEAEELYREVLAMQRRLYDGAHPNLATTLSTFASLLIDRGRLEEAKSFLMESVAMREQLFGALHDRTAGAQYRLAKLLLDTGDSVEAVSLFRKALQVSEEVNGRDHWKTAVARIGVGRALTALGRYAEAESNLVPAHVFFEREDAGGPPSGPRLVLEALVELYAAWGRPQQAARFEAALEALVVE